MNLRENIEMDSRFRGNDKNILGQSTIEFTFAMIAVMFLIFGMVMVFRWAGMDLAQRRSYEDRSITKADLGASGDPAVQLSAADDVILPIAAEYHGKITDKTYQ